MPRVRRLAPGVKSQVINHGVIPQTFTIGPYETDKFAILVGDEEDRDDGQRCYTGAWTREDLKDIIKVIQEALLGKFTES